LRERQGLKPCFYRRCDVAAKSRDPQDLGLFPLQQSTRTIFSESARRAARLHGGSKKEHSQQCLCHEAMHHALFAGRGYWFVLFEFSFAGYGGDDLAAVEAAVLYEDFRGLQAADDYAC
jgi:hypothetical protein